MRLFVFCECVFVCVLCVGRVALDIFISAAVVLVISYFLGGSRTMIWRIGRVIVTSQCPCSQQTCR